MKAIALILAVTMMMANNTSWLISDVSGMSAAGVFYVLRGYQILVLYGVVAALVAYAVSVDAKLRAASLLAYWACGWGAAEGFLSGSCRLAQSSPVPARTSICDHVTGLPVGSVMLALEVATLLWIVGGWVSEWLESRHA